MALSPAQQRNAKMLYGLAVSRGLPPPRAREFVAAAYAESSLNPQATNRSSGAAGFYQLLSSGYRQRAQQLGGLYNPRANALAILPDYQTYWRQHPGAAPGRAGAAVERSGEGAGFYSQPLRLLPGLGGGGVPAQQSGPVAALPPRPALAAAPQPAVPNLRMQLASALLKASQSGNYGGFFQTLQTLRRNASSPRSAPAGASVLALPKRREGGVPPTPPSPVLRGPAGYPLGTRGKIIGLPHQGSHTLYGNWESDNAIDIAAPVGTPVYAVADGVVGSQIGPLNSSDPHLLGNRLHLVTGGNEFYYAHLSRLAVKAGQRVHAGQLLGYSGAANGVAHLHIASRRGNPAHTFSR